MNTSVLEGLDIYKSDDVKTALSNHGLETV